MDTLLKFCIAVFVLILGFDYIETMDQEYMNVVRRAQCKSNCLKEHGTVNIKIPYIDANGVYKSKSCETSVCKDCKHGCEIVSSEMNCEKNCKNKMSKCYKSCLMVSESQNSTSISPKDLTLGLPKVICRYVERSIGNNTTSSIYIFWPMKSRRDVHRGDVVFILDYTEHHYPASRKVLITYSNQVQISQLRTNSTYKFTAQAVTMEGILSNTVENSWIDTLQENHKTQTPSNLRYSKHRLYNKRLSVLISWDPGEGPPCFYKVFGMSTCKEEDYKEGDLKLLHQDEYWINDLNFDCNYMVKLQPFGAPNFQSGGNYSKISFVTPRCLNVTNFNYSICAPENVTSIRYDTDYLYTKNYSMFGDIKLSWDPPKHAGKGNEILEYRIKWQKDVPYDNYHHLKYLEPHKGKNVTYGNQTWISLEGIHWYNIYRIEITAKSLGGVSTPAVKRINFGETNFKLVTPVKYTETPVPGLDQHQHTYVVSIGVSIGIVIVAFCLVFCIRWRREKRKQLLSAKPRIVREEEVNPIYRCSQSSSNCCQPLLDEHEIDFSNLQLLEIIGEGAFGKVHRAEYNSPVNGRVVAAVKMLKDFADRNEQRNLMSEIEAMKQLGNHPNIVSMLGYCTRGPELCLLMDYCPLGDLRKYLLGCRHKTNLDSVQPNKRNSDSGISRNSQSCTADHSTDVNYTDDSALTQYGFISQCSTDTRLTSASTGQCADDDTFLHEATLLSYARQIAMGMEYLSSKNFIHRDLAARNILMYDKKRLKISDFGLSRYIYETNMYQPTSARKLPYKWMAIESIFDQVFTVKSDIWSFGIVLWEIVTLGGCPYPGIPNEDLFHLLKDGYRMEKPENCSTEIYQMMLGAWHPNPTCRPTFTDLRLKLESMLELTKSYINLSVSVSQDYYQNDTSSNSEEVSVSEDHHGTNCSEVPNVHIENAHAYIQSDLVRKENKTETLSYDHETNICESRCKLCDPLSVGVCLDHTKSLPSHVENMYLQPPRCATSSSSHSVSQIEQGNLRTLCQSKCHNEIVTR